MIVTGEKGLSERVVPFLFDVLGREKQDNQIVDMSLSIQKIRCRHHLDYHVVFFKCITLIKSNDTSFF